MPRSGFFITFVNVATIVIILLTAAVSVFAFYGGLDIHGLKFNAYAIWHRRQWYRMLTYGLVHGGWGHLIFNMLTLWFFGPLVEDGFAALFGEVGGPVVFASMYVSALAVSTVGDLLKYRNDPYYNAVGASGAVSAVLFAAILFQPRMGIFIMFIPIPVPAWLFAPLYLVYCVYMARRNVDNIGHSAHFWGAVYGLVFPILCYPGIVTWCLSQLHLL